MREKIKEIEELTDSVKAIEIAKQELQKKVQNLDDQYKRDMNLFRSETVNREEKQEEERQKFQKEISRVRTDRDAAYDFLSVIRKDFSKVGSHLEKKYEHFKGGKEN